MIKQDMNMKYNFLIFLISIFLFSFVTSSCGMRRALTLPPEEKAQKEVEKKIDKDSEESEEQEIKSE